MQRRKQRRKNTYLDYNYDAAYYKYIDNLREDEIKRQIISQKEKYVYATKEIKSGDQLEVEIYPEFTRSQRGNIPEEGRRKKDRQRQAQNNLNEKNSRKQCERVILANFDEGDIWATFTYTDKNVPTSMEMAKKDIQKYIRRVNHRRKKMGLPNAKYVYVTECGNNGRCHHHIVMDGGLDMKIVEELWYSGRRNRVRRLKKDKNGLVGIAKYIAKTKGKEQKGSKFQRMWTPSKGLKKPKVAKNHYKTKQYHVHAMVSGTQKVEEHMMKWYSKEGYEFKESEIKCNRWNGQYYIYARLRKAK